ncbi:hypothetical protein ISF_00051 [Cordyceps fumosorosea ARSEF 2679]|uniref:RING zinc finger-like domain-containing protein n=1 Tax=Cordyceps fumosorosea (strain ARSEF 2679) TaxID=1081104 RepID=A0A168DY89_CORFA|nr:hypothetical protein ISF_00051 [Cordyceps fumosorosea ARSEF 2679]OAA73150.1 hypothetical protein ISF_00051 [Cordyceps fumosorosea ARSEF 2679]
MQEHIRRAHPEHYIPKLPATEESFLLMVRTPPSERPPADPSSAPSAQGLHQRQNDYRHNSSGPATPRHSDEYPNVPTNPLIGAATVLAELQGGKSNRDIDMDAGYHSDVDGRRILKTSIELPPFHQINHDVTSDPFRNRQLPSILSGSPPGRSSTLPPLQRPRIHHPRKQSISKRTTKEDLKRKTSRAAATAAEWLSHIQNEELTVPDDARKAASVEPSPDFGKRWSELVDAAASANGDLEDRTPMPQSPISIHRSSMPPFSQQGLQQSNYQASPLQQALTPPPYPSVENGENFHMGATGLSDSSPTYSSQNIQIYCAACQSISALRSSYACTECISGLCAACVEIIVAGQGARRTCPRCATIGGRFKPFQLDIR